MRKLVLLAVTAMAALAFSAPPASAAPVEVEWHPTGMMCSTQPGGHCRVHMRGEPVRFTRHTFIGEITFECRFEADLHIFNNGTGLFENEDLVDHPGGTGNCEDLVECDSPTIPPDWSLSLAHTGATETISLSYCIDPPLVSACEGTVTGVLVHTQVGNEEEYEAHFVDATVFNGATPTDCELDAEFRFERVGGIPPIEIHPL